MPNDIKYKWVRLPEYMIRDAEEKAKMDNLTKEIILERDYFGKEVETEIKEEVKEALRKQLLHEIEEIEPEKLRIIENWWRRRTKEMGTEIVKSCRDILAESVDHDT